MTITINKLTLGVIFVIIFLIGCGAGKINAEKPEGTITPDRANILEETYKEKRWNIINENIGYQDTREFVFELNRLKQYIAYVEAEATAMGYSGLGLRVYLGAYPEGFVGVDNERIETTVFFIPTAKNGPNELGTKSTNNRLQDDGENNDENINGIDGLNYASGGMPPKEYE